MNDDGWVIAFGAGRILVGRDIEPEAARLVLMPVFELQTMIDAKPDGTRVIRKAVPVGLFASIRRIELDRATTPVVAFANLSATERRIMLAVVDEGTQIVAAMRVAEAGVVVPQIVMPGASS